MSAEIEKAETLLERPPYYVEFGTGKAGCLVSVEVANQLTDKFANNYPNKKRAWTFDKELIGQLLSMEGCVGIRIYVGIDEEDQLSPVLFGVTKDGQDIREPSRNPGNPVVLDYGWPCPPYCGS